MNGIFAILGVGHGPTPMVQIPGADLLALFLLILLLCIVCVAGLFVWMASYHVREKRLRRKNRRQFAPAPPPHTPLLFQPTTWLAIRGATPLAVQQALDLRNATACSCLVGLAETETRRLFITPPLGDWVLVFGGPLPDPADDVDRCFHFLRELSRQLGHVQFFHARPVLGHHGWAMLEDGRPVRAYAWAGETVWNQGTVTEAERALGMVCHDYGSADDTAWLELQQSVRANGEHLPMLAGRWSIDPTLVDWPRLAGLSGVAGERR